MSEEEHSKDHIEKLRRLVGRIETINSKADDEQYKLDLLRSLPRSYNNLVVTLENLLDKLSIEDIHARIIGGTSKEVK